MKQKFFGRMGGMIAVTALSLTSYAEEGSKVEEWNKHRADIEAGFACEKGFLIAELANNTNYTNPGALETRRAELEESLPDVKPIESAQACNDKMYDALTRYLNGKPHKSLEDVEASFRSSIGNYLFGRWAMFQARVGRGDRLMTAMADYVEDRLMNTKNQLRRPNSEFGQDPGIQAAAKEDLLLKFWISRKAGGEPHMDTVESGVWYTNENLKRNGVFNRNNYFTSFEAVQKVIQQERFQQAVVGSVVANAVKAAETSKLVNGEKQVIVNPATYSAVFFQPIKFTATECASYVRTGYFTLSSSGLSSVDKCAEYAKKSASFTPPPVAVSPTFAKMLKPGVSNLNCFYNAAWIYVGGSSKPELARYTYTGQYLKQGVNTWAAPPLTGSMTQRIVATAVASDDQNVEGSRKNLLVRTEVPNQYNQPSGEELHSCVPISLYEGWDAKKKLTMFLGIPLSN